VPRAPSQCLDSGILSGTTSVTTLAIAAEKERIWSGRASEWNVPDMSQGLTAVPFAARLAIGLTLRPPFGTLHSHS